MYRPRVTIYQLFRQVQLNHLPRYLQGEYCDLYLVIPSLLTIFYLDYIVVLTDKSISKILMRVECVRGY